MKIYFGATQLTDWADYPAQNVSFNGASVLDAADVIDAGTKKLFGRKNAQVTLTFTVRREFASHTLAQQYLLLTFSSLTQTQHCKITCGPLLTEEEEAVDVWLPGAVLMATPEGVFNGVEVLMSFKIVAGLATLTDPEA